jgi:hypothetical protein
LAKNAFTAGTLSARIRRSSVAHAGAGMGVATSIVVPVDPAKANVRRQRTESHRITFDSR